LEAQIERRERQARFHDERAQEVERERERV
jgi:hypothetical protein